MILSRRLSRNIRSGSHLELAHFTDFTFGLVRPRWIVLCSITARVEGSKGVCSFVSGMIDLATLTLNVVVNAGVLVAF